MSEFGVAHTDCLGALSRMRSEYEQLQKWHRDSITFAQRVKTAEEALEAERKAHEETRAQVNEQAPKQTRVMRDLAENTERAKKKHGAHANIMVTLGVLTQEMHELQEAVHSREERAIRAELLDVATSALRGVEALDERIAARHKEEAEAMVRKENEIRNAEEDCPF